jgi:3-hydroxybutyryl-CoA dehydrogenase
MTLDAHRKDLTLGIVGTGIMGRGIAQIAAQAGIRTMLYDTRADAAATARNGIEETLCKLADKGKLTSEAVRDAVARIEIAHVLTHLSPCHVVVEAIAEDLEAKRELFRHLEGLVTPGCLLATNTSSLQVTAIAAGCKHPERVGGFHFFNPVPLMKVVEVIEGVTTAPWVGDALVALAERMGHTPVRAKDTPGFIVNHAGRAYTTEALQMLREGVAELAAIDVILRDVAGFRMGPFELLDLTGLDVSHPVMESIYYQYYEEPRYRPSPITAQRVVAGWLGRKSAGRGFYRYDANGEREPFPEATVPKLEIPPVWVSRRDQGPVVAELAAKLGARIDSGQRPEPGALIVLAPLGNDCTSAAAREGLDPTRSIAIDALVPSHKRRTLMPTPITLPEYRDAAHALFAADGVQVTMIRESAGFVAQRVLAHVVNVGCDIVQQRICTPEDLDRAVTLGLGYPFGPLAWGDRLGPQRVIEVLDAIHAFTGDPRYRASPWLRRRALLGVSLLTPEA